MSRPEDELIPEIPTAEEPKVERPEGFEMRERVASNWRGKDVVYQASQDIVNPDALFVCWSEGGEIRFHSSGDNVAALIVGALGAYMGWK